MSATFSDVPSSQFAPRTKGLKRVITVAFVGAAVIIAAWFVPLHSHPLDSQQRNLRLAQRRADFVAPLIHADPRFRQIATLLFTGKGGCLHIYGEVQSKEDAEILRGLVASTKPPVRTWFTIFTRKAESDQQDVVELVDPSASEL